MSARPCIGVDIGGSRATVFRFDADTWSIQERRELTAGPVDDYLAALGEAVRALAAEQAPDCLGIACGGPLDLRRGLVLQPPHLADWEAVPIVEQLGEAARGCPTILQNDANAGALAERYWGAGHGHDSLIFITFGTGFGAGIIANGLLISGWSGQAGEIGHLRLRDDGPVAYGKAGSVEAFCSGAGIARRFGRPARELFAAAATGDAQAIEQVRAIGHDVGQALAICVDLLNPRLLILGGIYMRNVALLAEPVRQGLAAAALPLNCRDVQILPATLGEAIGTHACMAIVRDHLENG